MTAVPTADDAEISVIGNLMGDPAIADSVINEAGLLSEHFNRLENRLLFDAVVESHYADDPTDPLTLGTRFQPQLAAAWQLEPSAVVAKLQALAVARRDVDKRAVLQHARLVRRASDGRHIVRLAVQLQEGVQNGVDPAELAGRASQEALRLLSSDDRNAELLTIADSGRLFFKDLRARRAAVASGVELGAYFGIPAFDEHTDGVQGTELMIMGGEPGVGKSAVAWRAGMNFATRQMPKPPEERVGALIVSIEMGHVPSNIRLTQALTGISGKKFRRAEITDAEERVAIEEWKAVKDLPLLFNYSPKLRASQLRALISEAIRKHNVGLVIIDHFRMFDLDKRLPNKNDEDEEKIRFLKEDIANEMNVAVICLAHTRKKDGMAASDARPRLSDLRGSGQIAAHADFVVFIHRPHKYASQDDIDDLTVQETDAEAVWEKNRHGDGGVATFFFDPSTMKVL